MCGITGFIDYSFKSDQHEVLRMADALSHRGPDAKGCELYTTDHAMVGLGHRRLSIIDLSPEGHQPMTSDSGRYVICLNGEIYNFQEIRTELEDLGAAPNWRGHSDTEVLLAAIEFWGLKRALQKSIGMFALALWDKKERMLSLARDRMGEKPLYYGWQGKTFLFASELKALRLHPNWGGEVDRGALCLFMRYAYIPAPYSIHQDIYKLEQGTILSLNEPKGREQELVQETYWSLWDVAHDGIENPFQGDAQEAVDELERLLLDAVGKQMVSDVPLGAFLSGGYDSSTITALMQARSSKPVKTFSIGFYEEGYNEAHHAKAVAQHLGTEHTEMYVTPDEAMQVIPELYEIYDEPFADSSQIPTYLLSKLTGKHVTVALSGDGGDELMRGYGRYNHALRLWNLISLFPKSIRSVLGRVFLAIPASTLDATFSWAKPFLTSYAKSGPVSLKLLKAGEGFRQPGFLQFYNYLLSKWKNPQDIVVGGNEPATLFDIIARSEAFSDKDRAMLYMDAMTYLPDDILVKVDRAAMRESLETRIPLLDHRIVEFAWRLPNRFRWQNNFSKWALRQVLYKYVPPKLMDRPKKGFALPIGDWIRGPMKNWAENQIKNERLKQQSLFDADKVSQIWKEHLSGEYENQELLWTVLMAQGCVQL
ncbi:MAG: asparagine synthase (glutamine-hydrolyzing) [Desulfobacteraceae bacterium]|nr:asparagine synthase (glutamine-hydrolyzing) [Desulfobacteraceae bacterium]